MGDFRHPVHLYQVSDADAPYSARERSIIEEAFDTLESNLEARLQLIILRTADGSYAFIEPHQSDVEFPRVVATLESALGYVNGE